MWDFSLPGYKYLGPGNSLRKGKPTNKNDAVALAHDIAYDQYIKKGKNPYLRYSSADEDFIKRATDDDYGGYLGKRFFQLKRKAADLGILGRVDTPSNKRLRGSTIEPLNEAKKRLRGAPNRPTGRPDNTSLLNSTTTTNMGGDADGGGSGMDAGLKETPLDNPYVIYRGPPDYTFASLPFTQTEQKNLTNVYAFDHYFRMTSPYDCTVESVAQDLNTGIGTATAYTETENSIWKARWFDYYAGLYKYYHVVGCQYNVFIENLSGQPIWAYCMFYNDTIPNNGASNEDMQLWNGVQYKYLDRRHLAVTSSGFIETDEENLGNQKFQEDQTTTAAASNYETTNNVANFGKSKCVFSGEYKPGQFRREIHLDSEVENWTAVTTNPSLPEKLLIRIKGLNEAINENDAITYGTDIKYRIQTKLNYLVEFKELVDGLRWPVRRQPVTVTVSADIDTVL